MRPQGTPEYDLQHSKDSPPAGVSWWPRVQLEARLYMGTVFDLPAISQRNGGQFRDSGPEDSSALQFPHKLAAGWELPAAQTRGGQALPPLKYAAAAHLESFRALCSRASGPALSCTQDLNFSCCDPFSELIPKTLASRQCMTRESLGKCPRCSCTRESVAPYEYGPKAKPFWCCVGR